MCGSRILSEVSQPFSRSALAVIMLPQVKWSDNSTEVAPGETSTVCVEIDRCLVRLIAGQFPHWAQLPIRPVVSGGWDNRIFHLGHDMTVRLPSARRYAAQVEKEQRWLLGLATLLPLPIPVPLAMGEPALGYPWHWSVYRWLEGEVVTIERIANLRSASQNFFSLCSGSTLLVGLDLGPTTSIAADHSRSMTRRLVRQSETWGERSMGTQRLQPGSKP
jgi:hypothetical protein